MLARSFRFLNFSAWADWARRFAARRMLPVEVTSRERFCMARLSDLAASEGGLEATVSCWGMAEESKGRELYMCIYKSNLTAGVYIWNGIKLSTRARVAASVCFLPQ